MVQCLDMLVRNFLPPSCGLPIFIDFFSRRALMKGMPKEMLMQRKIEHLERKASTLHLVHSAIRRISELVPMTVMHLHPIVLQRMPHRIVDKEVCIISAFRIFCSVFAKLIFSIQKLLLVSACT